MPEQHDKRNTYTVLMTLAGTLVFTASLLLSVAFPRIDLFIAFLIGCVLSFPFFILGLRRHPQSSSDAQAPAGFWPTQSEAKNVLRTIVLFVAIGISILGPLFALRLVGSMIPQGDTWDIVMLRLFGVVLPGLCAMWWISFSSKKISHWMHDNHSSETQLSNPEQLPLTEPFTAYDLLKKELDLLVFVTLAACVTLGIIDFNNPVFNIDAPRGKAKGLGLMIEWMRANPNTVRTSAAVIAVSAILHRIMQSRRPPTGSLKRLQDNPN